jgi:DNA polymerase elongation subunit (family B)
LKIGKHCFEIGVADGYTYDIKYEEFDIDHLKWFMCMIIYGDTDSIFIRMNIINKNTKELIIDKRSLKWSINLGQIASKMLKINLPYPQNMEYEKTFYPFCILAKKKYVGNKYEDNPNKFKQACMGIVLKRRDNPPIVKKIISGMLDIMLNIMDNDQVVQYVRTSVQSLLDGKFSIRNFITSKALKDGYKYKDGDIDQNGKEITKTISIIETFNNIHMDDAKKRISYVKQAHVQLAARMAIRDPGNKPQLNDRIPYIAIEVQSDKKLLQGDVIEHPEYIIKNNLKIDYLFYLTNQIMKPSIQFLELIVNEPNKLFNEYCDKIKKNKELAYNEKKRNECISKMVNNYGFKMNTNNEDWDINIDGLIKQVQNNIPNTEKTKSKKKKK